MFRLRTIQQVNRFVCGIIGIPLNLLVVAVILRSRQLWTARNIFWLAINFFNTLALTQAIIELAVFYLYQRGDDSHRILCQIYSTIVGGPYVLLLAGLMLATLDRHLALVHRQFYQNYATPTNVIWILFGITLVVVGRYKLFSNLMELYRRPILIISPLQVDKRRLTGCAFSPSVAIRNLVGYLLLLLSKEFCRSLALSSKSDCTSWSAVVSFTLRPQTPWNLLLLTDTFLVDNGADTTIITIMPNESAELKCELPAFWASGFYPFA